MLLELTFSALSALSLLSPMAEAEHLAADAQLEAAGGLSIPVKADLPAGAKLSLESRVGRVLVQQSIRKEPRGRLDSSAAALRKGGEGGLQGRLSSGAACAACAGAQANSAAVRASAFEAEPSLLAAGPGPKWRDHCPVHELRLEAICAGAEPRPFPSAMRGAIELDRDAGVWSNSRRRPASHSTADGSAVDRRSTLSASVASGQLPCPSQCYARAAPSVSGMESRRLPGPSGPSPENARGV